ncbi:hypothetical protein [Parabacteroides faecis]|uniref:hypothetical protein n=1 Tax=Parabacteroides faecis TaxID=1217282 RepID=UPI0035206B23
MLKKILSVFGAIALTLGVGMNLRYSLNDYGMGTNSLSTFALAQTNSSSSSSSSSGSSGWFWTLQKTTTECTYTSEPISGSISGSLPGGASVSISAGGGAVITYKGNTWECNDGWNPFCTKDCRAN